jgi:hypothetical protein
MITAAGGLSAVLWALAGHERRIGAQERNLLRAFEAAGLPARGPQDERRLRAV